MALTGAVKRLSFPLVLQLARAAFKPNTQIEWRAAFGAAKASTPLAVCKTMQSPSCQFPSGISTLCTIVVISSLVSRPLTPCKQSKRSILAVSKEIC